MFVKLTIYHLISFSNINDLHGYSAEKFVMFTYTIHS